MINPSEDGEYPVVTGIGFGKHKSHSEQSFELKYNFKPDSIDDTRQSTLTRSGSEFTLESPGVQNGESFVFTGQHTATKDIDCLLVYDKETESFVLHHVSGIIRLKSQRSATKPSSSHAPPPGGHHNPPASSSVSSTSNSPAISATLKSSKNDKVIELPALQDAPVVEAHKQLHVDQDSDGELEQEPATSAAPRAGTIPRRQPSPISDEDESDADDNGPPVQADGRQSRVPITNSQDVSSDEDDDRDVAMTDIPQQRQEESSDEDNDQTPAPSQNSQPSLIAAPTRRPISLRGYAGGDRVEDDLSSSSEEE
ncbi:RNA polymerase II transcription elongation factor-domain-containing protein [Lipomyces kononenkoae]|uniref:RNA polymerase II transcription elongation factor-domain-containing protein n=1 Tax=Lipomyces kononenkoae TaxID=34357 RepID=A0ACC3SYD4_LIPKO